MTPVRKKCIHICDFERLNVLDRGTKVLIIVNLVLMVILSGMAFFFFGMKSPAKKAQPETKNIRSEISGENQRIDDSGEIMNVIRRTLGDDSSRYSVYIFRPGIDEEPVIFNSKKMQPASMIKMFVLAKAMSDVKNGSLLLDEPIVINSANIVGGAGSLSGYGAGREVPVRLALELMISQSDNTATNILIDRLGIENINKYISENGYSDTKLNHKMMLVGGRESNYSSARDLGNLFKKIYNHECVDYQSDQLMISWLLKQEAEECLPTALPFLNIAHKTGESDDSYHEGGICFGSSKDLIIVMMNDNLKDRTDTIEKMKKIASTVAKNFLR